MKLDILKNCRDEPKLPNIIPSTYGIGMTFKDENETEYTTILGHSKTGARELIARITSWRGISAGAIHYYGKITCYDLPLKYINEDGKEEVASISGYFNRHKPNESKGFTIELVRKLTQQEIDEDPERWEYYNPGDITNCFYTEDDVFNLIKEIFKKRFKGHWILEIDDIYGRTKKIIKKKTKI